MTHKSRNRKRDPSVLKILFVLCLVIAAAAILVVKNQPEARATTAESPAELLNTAIQNKQPVLAFFHSNNCDSCIQMVAIVDQVYPEFSDSILLVDVNVYDKQNQPLLNEVGLKFIPTLYFYDITGKRHTHIGTMDADQLRQTLNGLRVGD